MGPRRSRKGSGHPLCDRLPLTLAQRAMLLGTLPLQRVHALKSRAAGTGKCDIVRHAKCVDVRGEDSAQEKVKPNSRHNSHSLILRVNSDSWPTPLLWVNSSETTTRICEYGVVLLGYFSEIIVIRWLNIARR